MDSVACIEQKGVVAAISKGMITVNITTASACANCHAKKGCNFLNSETRHIMVQAGGYHFKVGESVRVLMKRSLGLKATLIAYIIPLLILVITLLTLSSLKLNELFVGLTTLLILVPYFLLVYRFRESLKNTFTFRLNKEG
jgi:sigma-E factor negative regulatory protein RseC